MYISYVYIVYVCVCVYMYSVYIVKSAFLLLLLRNNHCFDFSSLTLDRAPVLRRRNVRRAPRGDGGR